VGLGWLGWRHRQTVPLLGAGLIFFLVSHALTLPFAKVGEFELRADHYNYVACLGFFVALVAGFLALKKRYASLDQVFSWAGIGWVTLLGLLAIGQVRMWSSTVNLMNQAMANGYFQNGKMYLWRGMAYGNMGKRSEIPKAMADFEQALKMNPELVDAYKYRGALYGVTGQYAQSVADLDRYLATQPADAPEYRFNRSISLINLNRRPEAMQELNKVIEEKPDFARAYRIRGSLRFEMGDSLSAQKDLDEFNRLGGEDVEPQTAAPTFLK
jgi:tetratricopeptide (TPR) repeat protein